MILLVSGGTKTVYRLGAEVGILLTPRDRNSVERINSSGKVWACDNDCFTGLNEKMYRAMLEKLGRADRQNLKFVTAPDVVANHSKTLTLFGEWKGELKSRTLPIAFVCQDGAEVDTIPWSDLSAVFIGGRTKWKLGAEAEKIIGFAKAKNLWVHVGRVNAPERIRHCQALGVDSVDGSQFSRWPATHIPWAIEILRQENKYLWSI